MSLDPGVVDSIRSIFESQGLMRHLGARADRVEEGLCAISLPRSEKVTQQHGYFHAGAIGSIADSAGGGAALTLQPPGTSVVSIEYKLNLLTPADGDLIVATASVVRAGKRIAVCQAEVESHSESGTTKCAVALMTMMCIPERRES